eukprot:3175913-Prymnesium_polylepis.1
MTAEYERRRSGDTSGDSTAPLAVLAGPSGSSTPGGREASADRAEAPAVLANPSASLTSPTPAPGSAHASFRTTSR